MFFNQSASKKTRCQLLEMMQIFAGSCYLNKDLMWVLRTWLRLALAVVARAGGFRVQTECAWHWGQFRGQLCIDLFWSDRPQRPATVSDGIPTILLQHFTTLPGLWDHTQHINTRPVDGRECQWLYTYLQICSLNPLYTWRNMCNCLICFVGEMLKVNMTACDSVSARFLLRLLQVEMGGAD